MLTRDNAVILTGPCGAITPNTPTVTRTITNTSATTATNTPTITPTRTTTLTPGPTDAAVLAYSGDEPVLAYPNPGSAQAPVGLDVYLTKQADFVTIKIYTASLRCIRIFKYGDSFMTVNGSVAGMLHSGRNILKIQDAQFSGLAQGTYYYVVLVSDDVKKNLKSKVQKLVILNR